MGSLTQTTDILDTVRNNVDMLASVRHESPPADDQRVVADVVLEDAVEDRESLLALFLLRDVVANSDAPSVLSPVSGAPTAARRAMTRWRAGDRIRRR